MLNSVANCVAAKDFALAARIAALNRDASIADMFAHINHKTKWELSHSQEPLRRFHRKRNTSWKENLHWLLAQKKGFYLVRPIRRHRNNKHIVGVDCDNKVIYDSMNEHPLRLSKEALFLCYVEETRFAGVEIEGKLSPP